jgi:hypothetical protein
MEPALPGSGLLELHQPPPKRPRFGENQKFLPIIFVVVTICFLFCSYINYHIRYLLQLDKPVDRVDPSMRTRGMIELVIFLYLTTLLLICYLRSILAHPGEIPDGDPQWEYLPQDGQASDWMPMSLQEMKKTGERRHCKWCGKYKPDRCHHCRVCKACILKMDHHCPWIYNCVGFANYKWFFLLLLYAVLDCHLIVWTMAESVKRCVDEPDTRFVTMFMTFFTETLSLFLAVLTTLFFGFHIWLMMKAMTTIEFCEKSLPKKDGEARSYDSSVYNLGFFGNIRVVLGDDILLWFFPVSAPSGDGLNFMSDETRLAKDMESGKGVRRRTHQKTQRVPRRHFGEEQRIGGGYYAGLGYGDPIRPS